MTSCTRHSGGQITCSEYLCGDGVVKAARAASILCATGGRTHSDCCADSSPGQITLTCSECSCGSCFVRASRAASVQRAAGRCTLNDCCIASSTGQSTLACHEFSGELALSTQYVYRASSVQEETAHTVTAASTPAPGQSHAMNTCVEMALSEQHVQRASSVQQVAAIPVPAASTPAPATSHTVRTYEEMALSNRTCSEHPVTRGNYTHSDCCINSSAGQVTCSRYMGGDGFSNAAREASVQCARGCCHHSDRCINSSA